MNAASFLAYVEQVLVSTLRPGDIVAMDNLSSHKGVALRRAIRAANAKLQLCQEPRICLHLIRTGPSML